MTALTDMAAPARPGSSEARVPCPLCGGLVHPVAGRCKHCKQDLTQFRAGRPQAQAALPALAFKAAAATNGHANGHAIAPPPVVVREESAPILPPRESASMPAARDERTSTFRRWPVVVIILAVLAIVGAVVVMVWIPPGGQHGDKSLAPPPAPERMETNPIPEPNRQPQPQPQPQAPQDDPWGAPHAQAQPQAPVQPRQTPDPVPDLQDPFSNGGPAAPLAGGGGGFGGMRGGNVAFVGQFGRHVCDRLAQCGMGNDPMVDAYCNMMKTMPGAAGSPSCDAAKRCLQHVDQLSCSMQTDDAAALTQLITQLPDCFEAMTRC